MGRKHFKAEEIIQHLRTVELEIGKGLKLEEAARKLSITPQTIIRWRKEYGGLRLDQAKRLKELESENARLKKIVANQAVEVSILKEVATGNY
jgi:transposase-like protein